MAARVTSLRRRLLVLVLGAVLLLWATVAVLTWVDAQHELDELLDSHLAQSAALLLARQWEDEDGDHGRRRERSDRPDRPDRETPLLHRYAQRTAYQVFHDGVLALRSANAPTTPMADHARGFATVTLGGERWRVFAARGAESDMRVYVGEQIDSRAAILRAVLRSLAAPLAVALPLLALALWWAVHRGLAPLARLQRELAQRTPGALQPLALPEAPAEVAPVVDTLNALFARIAALLEGERRFTADAAHELRTPIAAIRTQAQVALGAGTDDAARTRALQATLAGCDRAAHLVEQLLTLSRLEATPGTGLPVDWVALARRAVGDAAPAALAKSQDIALDIAADAPMLRTPPGHEALLAVLLRNLLDNAVRYSPREARIQVTLDAQGLTVEDSGPGLGAADLARLGERFFRVLGSGEAGSGLGWSIVRRIAQLHALGVAVDASPALGGLRVRLAFSPSLNRGAAPRS